MSFASPLRLAMTLAGTVLSCTLLSGCSITGTYPDATDPDAAKVRFVANTDNATMNYFDAQHCDGLTTGILNNLLLRDSNRRVGMIVAPPEKARGYLEFKLKPEQEAYLNVNTQVGYAVCGSSFSFTPKRGNEYEVTLDLTKSQCITSLRHLERIGGKDVRTVIPLDHNPPAACVGLSPLFPKPLESLPDTPERTVMIDRIVDGSLFVAMKSDPRKPTSASVTGDKIDALVRERKAKMGFDMPDEYWTLYRQNMLEFDNETDAVASEAMTRSSAEYRKRLRSVDDKRLKEWSTLDGTSGKRGNTAPTEMETAMIQYYLQSSKDAMREAVRRHFDRLAKMDAQYNVCSRFAECWKP
jgi:hypothetical protein